MIIREPLVFATYYYLREVPGEGAARRDELHAAFVDDARGMVQSIAGWMAMPAPVMPPIPMWSLAAPDDLQPLAKTSELKGRTNATAWVGAYVLRNMLLLRVVLARAGEHDEGAWKMLNQVLTPAPTTPSWLHTTYYWCGTAPRMPETLEDGRSMPIQTPFGVLSLAVTESSHVLVYPDARAEARANRFLRIQAPHLDWYPVQARHRLEEYLERAARATQSQQRALDQIASAMQDWANGGVLRTGALLPLHEQLALLETAHARALDDLTETRAAAHELGSLALGYRTRLVQSGLWDAAPSLWAAQVEALIGSQQQIDADVAHIETTLRRIETLISSAQIRMAASSSAQTQRQLYLLLQVIAVIGLALLAVLVIDTDLTQVGIRLLALAAVSVLAWLGWRRWIRQPQG